VKRDGTLWAMGYNAYGQLGLGDTTDRDTPTLVTSDVVAVAAGAFHSVFVKRDGTLWAMGWDKYGQLGSGSGYNYRDTPTQVSGVTDVVAVAAGEFQTLFVKRDGTLWAMGSGYAGELGLGDDEKEALTPTLVTSDVVAVAASSPGELDESPLYSYSHSLFVKRDGTLWGMGHNGAGQLGGGGKSIYTPTLVTSDDVVAVAAGIDRSLFVKRDGTLWAMGWNKYGQLGLGDTTNRDTPTQVYFRDAATPLIVATLAKTSSAYHSLVIAKAPPLEVTPPVDQDQAVAFYDDQTGILTISEVRVGDKAYRVELINLGDFEFELTDVQEISASEVSPAYYDVQTQLVNIPNVFAFDTYYQVQLKDEGDNLFNLVSYVVNE
jgi:hypothetical protein